MMSPVYAKAVIFSANTVMAAIRAPHGRKSRRFPVVASQKGRLECAVLTINRLAFFLPLIWIATPAFSFSDYSLRPAAFWAGACCMLVGLGLFQRSHAALGANFSATLEVRENHQLVTEGVYRRIRHPMYLAFFVYLFGIALVVPNWLVGPAEGVAMLLLFAVRVGPEERMMLKAFGAEYRAYMASTKRLLPSVW